MSKDTLMELLLMMAVICATIATIIAMKIMGQVW